MPSLHNPTADALDIPALGLTIHSGETISVTDEEAEGFVGHGVLELLATGGTVNAPPSIGENSAPALAATEEMS